MSQHRRLYNNRRWKNRRAKQLREEPLCRRCKERGEVTEATVADHIDPHEGDENKFWHGALQSLCKHDHDSYKQRLEKSGTVVGCDQHGLPVDPRHHWNTGGGGVEV